MSVILLGRLLGVPLSARQSRDVQRLDRAADDRRRSRHGWRVFSLGGARGVFETAAATLRAAHPGLILDGAHGYFDATPGSAETTAVLERIAAFRPLNVLLVGMGMPRQEHWVRANRSALTANATLMAGAAMDYVAGVVPTPPRGASSFKFSVVVAACRLAWPAARRYLIEPWYVMGLVLAAWLRRRPGR